MFLKESFISDNLKIIIKKKIKERFPFIKIYNSLKNIN